MSITDLFGIELPIIQAPMAGVQGSALAIAVSHAGGLGSLPGAMLTPDTLAREIGAIRAGTDRPFNLNFFCHTPPVADAQREADWRSALAPYYRAFGIDPHQIASGPGRSPFSAELAELIAPFRPPVVSFHFGLPSPELLDRVKAWAARVLSSATTVEEALWLEERGVDAIIAQQREGRHTGQLLLAGGNRLGTRIRRLGDHALNIAGGEADQHAAARFDVLEQLPIGPRKMELKSWFEKRNYLAHR